ncbi:hypothetical protein N9933_01210, partial [bacterium]|nr:hypothetical protein [bacterium]
IKVKVLKASKYVANSKKELEEGFYPDATHVIFDEAEEVKVRAAKVEIKKKAIIQSASLSKDKKIQIILILSGKNLKGKSDNFVEVELDKLTESKPTEVLRHLNFDAEDLTNHALVLEALQKSVFRKKGHNILYIDSIIGTDILEVVDYLKKDENQSFRLNILGAVNE